MTDMISNEYAAQGHKLRAEAIRAERANDFAKAARLHVWAKEQFAKAQTYGANFKDTFVELTIEDCRRTQRIRDSLGQ